MKITRVDTKTVTMPLEEGYTIAYETVESTCNVFIRLETGGNIVGYGLCRPGSTRNRRNPRSRCSRPLHDRLSSRSCVTATPLRWCWIMEELKRELPVAAGSAGGRGHGAL